MRCKTCHYSLEHLTEHRCPECGRAFDPNDPNTFAETSTSSWKIAFIVVLSLIVLVCLGFLAMFVYMSMTWDSVMSNY